MSQKPLNVWRIYMDLFSNILGLVIFGGASIAFVVNASGSAETKDASKESDKRYIAENCYGGDDKRVQKLFIAHEGVPPITLGHDCEIVREYPNLHYKQGDTNVDGYDNKSLDVVGKSGENYHAFCEDLRDFVSIATKYTTKGSSPYVWIFGHASSEYENTKKCRTDYSEQISNNEDILKKKGDYQNAKKLFTLLFHASPNNPEKMDGFKCNNDIANMRASLILSSCSAYPYSLPYEKRGAWPVDFDKQIYSHVKLTADPENPLTGSGEACNGKQGNNANECRRTVTLHLMLRPKSMAPAVGGVHI